MYLFFLYTFFLAFYLASILAFYLAFSQEEVDRKGTSSGPAGTTPITCLQLRSGRGHSDPGLAVRVRQDHCDLTLAVD